MSVSGGSFRLPWGRSGSFQGSKKEGADVDAASANIASATGSVDPLLALSYSSSAPGKHKEEPSAAPIANKGEALGVSLMDNDESSAEDLVEALSAAPSDSDEEILFAPSMELGPEKVDAASVAAEEEHSAVASVKSSASGVASLKALKSSPSGSASLKSSPSGAASLKSSPSSAPSMKSPPSVAASLKSSPSGVASLKSSSSGAPSMESSPSVAASLKSSPSGAASLKSSPSGAPSMKSSVYDATSAKSFISGTASAKSSPSATKSSASSTSSDSTKDQENESTTSMSESTDVISEVDANESNHQHSVEPEEGQSSGLKQGKGFKPPLFPRRSRSNTSSLKKNMKPGVASFFRSRSNPTKPESERSLENTLKASSEDGRIGARRDVVNPGCTVASVSSCSEDTVEVIALDSKISGTESWSKATLDTEDVDVVKREARDAEHETVTADSTTGATKASSDVGVFSKTVNGIYATLSSVSNEIQDPWPNPWSDVGKMQTALAGAAMTPRANTTQPVDSVLENVVGVVMSSNIDSAVAEKKTELVGDAPARDLLPNPTAGNPDLVQASLAEECMTAEDQPEDVATCTSLETDSNCDEDADSPAPLKDWKELLTAETSSVGGLENEEKTAERGSRKKGATRRQSSLWRRTKSMVKTRYSTASQQRGSPDIEKTDVSDTKKGQGQKFKLGCLCLLNPCNKKVHESPYTPSTEIKPEELPSPEISHEVEIGQEVESEHFDTQQVSAEQVDVEQLDAEQVDAEQITLQADGHDDLIEILGTAESCDAFPLLEQQPAEQPAMEEQKVADISDRFVPNVEEAKSDLIQLEIARFKQNSRSWIEDIPSMESFMAKEPRKTFSEMSSIGDLSHDAAGPNMISSINFYVNAASKAVQHNLYDVPVRELERLRDMSCGPEASGEEQSSLLDKELEGVTVSESQDSLASRTKTPLKVGRTKRNDPLSLIVRELVDVLECGPMQDPTLKTSNKNNKFEEEKIEMFGSTSRGDTRAEMVF